MSLVDDARRPLPLASPERRRSTGAYTTTDSLSFATHLYTLCEPSRAAHLGNQPPTSVSLQLRRSHRPWRSTWTLRIRRLSPLDPCGGTRLGVRVKEHSPERERGAGGEWNRRWPRFAFGSTTSREQAGRAVKQPDARTSLDMAYDVCESPVRPRSTTLLLPRKTLPPPTAAYRDHMATSVARTACHATRGAAQLTRSYSGAHHLRLPKQLA